MICAVLHEAFHVPTHGFAQLHQPLQSFWEQAEGLALVPFHIRVDDVGGIDHDHLVRVL